MSWRFEFHIVMSVANSTADKQCSVRRFPQLFLRGCVSYVRYLCLLACGGVQHILCCVFALFFFVFCASFSGLSFFVVVPSVFSNAYLIITI